MEVKDVKDDKNIETIYEIAKKWVNDNGLHSTNVMELTLHLMQVIQKIITDTGKGGYKKMIVLTVLRLVIKNDVQWENEQVKNLLLETINTIVPSAIDQIVSVAKGLVNLKKLKFKLCCC